MVTRYMASYNDYYENDDGEFVTYQDYAVLEARLLALLDHPAMKAHTDALHEAQTTGLAFIRVNANGHVQVLPVDRVQISVIQAVDERTTAAQCEHPRWRVGPFEEFGGEPPGHWECVDCGLREPFGASSK